MKKQIEFLIIMLLVTALLSFQTTAHSSSQAGILEGNYLSSDFGYGIGSEDGGWIASEGIHIGRTTFSFSFATDSPRPISDAVKEEVREAATQWADIVTINELSAGASGTIFCVCDTDSGLLGTFTAGSPIGADGHYFGGWSISLNTYFEVDNRTVAHEFGHVIGLYDLYSQQNIDKLMYHCSDSTATGPTDADRWGAKVILGLHTTHTFTNYRYWGQNSSGKHFHVQYCSDCNGSAAIHSPCTTQSGGVTGACFVCGYNPGGVL